MIHKGSQAPIGLGKKVRGYTPLEGFLLCCVMWRYRDTSLIRKHPPPQDYPRTLGIGVRQGPRGGRFLTSEVPLVWPTSRGEGDPSVFKVGNPSKLAFLVRNTSF